MPLVAPPANPHNAVMFDAWCDGCGKRVLVSTRRITALVETPDGLRIEFVCWRGHPGTWAVGDTEPTRSIAS